MMYPPPVALPPPPDSPALPAAAAVVMVYDFLPAAETLMSRHFSQPPQLNGFADPFQDPSIPRPYSAQKNAVLRQKNGGWRRAAVGALSAVADGQCAGCGGQTCCSSLVLVKF